MQLVVYSSRHNPLTASRATFPIMMVDQHVLTPAMGYLFNPKWIDPCESLVSIMWKFTRANAAAGPIVARLLGANIDPYEGLVPVTGIVDVGLLRETFRLPGKALHRSLLLSSQRRRYSENLRVCRRCLGRGYHSVVYQFSCVRVCPIHQTELDVVCRRCGYAAPYVINVALLESPYRCVACRGNYGSKTYSPVNHQHMSRGERATICHAYYRANFG